MIVELKDREQATVRAHKNHQLINQPANRIRPPPSLPFFPILSTFAPRSRLKFRVGKFRRQSSCLHEGSTVILVRLNFQFSYRKTKSSKVNET